MNKRVFTVSQINSYVGRIFNGDYALKHIYLKGEVSNCKYHSSGNIFFSLKDEHSTIRCIMFRQDKLQGLSFTLEDGQMVIAGGRISVFERDGVYQLYVKDIELSGRGELYLRYEQLKKELAEKGYFDFERKKTLPMYPRKIGIVTASTGAAIEDIKSVAGRRNPFVQLYLYPAIVQGAAAAPSIAAGIRYFDRTDVDVVIIGRGGGSIEDLWAFNERIVADAIYSAQKVIVSGTGHEIDMTIADYCADLRAPTPSAACEQVIPDIGIILNQLNNYYYEMNLKMEQKLLRCRSDLELLTRKLDASRPDRKLLEKKMLLSDMRKQLDRRIEAKANMIAQTYRLLVERISGLNPAKRLQGGYAFAQTTDYEPISSVVQLNEGEAFELIFSDGEALVTPERIIKHEE